MHRKFIVYPMGVTFPLKADENGDTYIEAQIYAARTAAEKKLTTYVYSEHTHMRMGLGNQGLTEVMAAGCPAYWNAQHRTWSPIPETPGEEVVSDEAVYS